MNLMRLLCLLILTICLIPSAFSQQTIRGVIADSATRKALPFATIRPQNGQETTITGINGQFSISLSPAFKLFHISYVNYNNRILSADSLKDNDTIFLAPAVKELGEVIVRPQTEKIRRIINAAVRNKPLHNPEMYEAYRCNIYYKMKLDMKRTALPATDSSKPKARRKPRADDDKKDTTVHRTDSSRSILSGNNHLIFTETFSHRVYRRPQQLQETIIASRFSGLKKTYFSNLVTDVLPFHVYSDFIPLNGKDYINPVSKGWQRNYEFRLADEIHLDNDTIFVLSFKPKKGVGFNSLTGFVYINSDGYAISHFSGSAGDTANGRELRIEQVYNKVNQKWFPRELNYAVIYNHYIMPGLTMEMNGHSLIDSAAYALPDNFRFDKARPVKLSDSVDLRSEHDWHRMRPDSITIKEKNTYRVMDSLFEKRKLEKLITSMSKMALGRLPVGIVDIDVTRLIASNNYEDTRTGIGLYTNDKLSKYFSVGGWAGYGWKDKKLKYGVSGTAYFKGNKDNWFRLFYNDDYQNAGNIHIHSDIDRSGYRTWLLTTPDHVSEYGATLHAQRGYWEIEADSRRQSIASLYPNNFQFDGKNYRTFTAKEASIGLRYAYGEKRVPVFEYYFPTVTKYPIAYLRSSLGTVGSGDYTAKYARVVGSVTFQKHLNRWGNDDFRLEGGFIHAFDNKPLSRSFLLASKGFRRDGMSYYAEGGFLTMRPFDYYCDRYISFLYKHDFDKFLWQLKFSKPFISVAHNMMYGNMSNASKTANEGLRAPVSGYHESGLLLNQLLQINFFRTSYIYFNTGAFYHWTPTFDKKNVVWMVGLSTGF